MHTATLDTPPLDATVPPCPDASLPINTAPDPSTTQSDLLSPTDLALLRALSDPAADTASIAAAYNLDLPSLALWFAQPHVQHSIAAMRALEDHHHALWQREARKEAVEILREVARTTEEPVERRRAASAILRALRAPTAPREGTPDNAKAGQPPPQDDASWRNLDARQPFYDHYKAFIGVPPSARLDNNHNDPLSPQCLTDLDRGDRARVPTAWREDPAILIDRIADRLARLPEPTPDRVDLAIRDAMHIDLFRCKGMRKPFIAAVVASPLLIPSDHPDWTRTTHQLHSHLHEAWRTFSWRHHDGRIRRCTITLRYDNGDDGRCIPEKWSLFAIHNSESRDPLAEDTDTPIPKTEPRPPPGREN